MLKNRDKLLSSTLTANPRVLSVYVRRLGARGRPLLARPLARRRDVTQNPPEGGTGTRKPFTGHRAKTVENLRRAAKFPPVFTLGWRHGVTGAVSDQPERTETEINGAKTHSLGVVR